MSTATRTSAAADDPDLFAPEIMARVRQIQIHTHRLVSEVLSGAYKSTLRGTGIEFEEVRPYLPGDDTRAIDWNVTARAGAPFIKTYREERQLTLQFVVDTSASMNFGSARITKRELAAEFCALLSFVAAQARDPVGLTLFDSEPGLYLPPGQGPHHALRIVREIVAAPARAVASDAPNPLGAALDHAGRLLRRRSLVFVVSDFAGDLGLEPGARTEVAEEWTRPLSRLAQRHDVICVRTVDPLEVELPRAGIVRLAALEGGGEVEVDTRSARVRAAWATAAEERRLRLCEALDRARVDRIDLSTAGDLGEPVVRFFRGRQRGRGAGRRRAGS